MTNVSRIKLQRYGEWMSIVRQRKGSRGMHAFASHALRPFLGDLEKAVNVVETIKESRGSDLDGFEIAFFELLGTLILESEDQKRVAFNIREARRTVNKGDVKEALSYLERISGTYISEGEIDDAKALLDEAQKIIEDRDDAALFHLVLRIALLNQEIERNYQADSLISRFIDYALINIRDEQSEDKRGHIREVLIGILVDIGKINQAIDIVRGMNNKTLRFKFLRDIALACIEKGDLEKGTYLLNECVEVARMQDNPHAKTGQLIKIAKRMISIGENERAEQVLKEASDNLSVDHDEVWLGVIGFLLL